MLLCRLYLLSLLATTPSLAAAQVIVDTSTGRTITIKVVTPPPAPTDTLLLQELRPGHPLLRELTGRTRRISLDTLLLYSALGAPGWPYTGDALDTTFEALFAPFYRGLHFPHVEPHLFATNRFVLDAQHVGYLLRVPGMYESSALDLWIYDARSMRFAVPERLAESWGDEGCGYDLESLFIRSNTDRQVKLVVHKNTGCSDIESGAVLSNSDSLWVRRWSGNAFDTARVATDSVLFALFRRLRQRRSR